MEEGKVSILLSDLIRKEKPVNRRGLFFYFYQHLLTVATSIYRILCGGSLNICKQVPFHYCVYLRKVTLAFFQYVGRSLD